MISRVQIRVNQPTLAGVSETEVAVSFWETSVGDSGPLRERPRRCGGEERGRGGAGQLASGLSAHGSRQRDDRAFRCPVPLGFRSKPSVV